MESLKVIISGPFKEKALLSNAIGELLEKENLQVRYNDNSIKNLVDEKYEDCLYELQTLDFEVIIEVESLRKVNSIDDLNYFYKSLDSKINETMTVKDLKEHLRKILLND